MFFYDFVFILLNVCIFFIMAIYFCNVFCKFYNSFLLFLCEYLYVFKCVYVVDFLVFFYMYMILFVSIFLFLFTLCTFVCVRVHVKICSIFSIYISVCIVTYWCILFVSRCVCFVVYTTEWKLPCVCIFVV